MSNQKKVGIGQAAIQSWKEGFENALTRWRNSVPENKQERALALLAFVGTTGATLQNFVDDPAIGITPDEAEQIRKDFKTK